MRPDPIFSIFSMFSFSLPPATPLLMVLRMGASSAVPWWQPALGILIMLAATWLCVFAAARVFRIGILAQGKTPKLAELLRWAVRG
jgi:ABC-2 type transport system permease protein